MEPQLEYEEYELNWRIFSGILKQKFRILDNGVDAKLETCRMIVVACSVLYNISLDMGEQPEQPIVGERGTVIGEGGAVIGGVDNGQIEEGEVVAGEAASKAAGEELRNSLLRFF